MAKSVTDKINSQLHSALTKDEIAKLCKLFAESEMFNKDKNGNKLNLYKAIENYGFSFEDIYKITVVWVFDDPYYIGDKPEDYPPVIATGASCKSNDVNNSTSVYSDETARFDGYNPLADSLVTTGCTYYHYRQYQGCDYRETGDQTPYRLIYFAPAA